MLRHNAAMQRLYVARGLRGFVRGLLLVAVIVVAMLGLICALIVLEGQRDDLRNLGVGRVGAAVVLGAAQWSGDRSLVQRARLDHALDLYRRGQVRLIVLTGGVGAGDTLSEAAAGKQYLLGRGLPAEALLTEDHSTTTWENLRNSVPLIQSNQIGAVVLVSDPFHMLRSLKMARDLGLIAYGSPTRTSPISASRWQAARYVVREAWDYLRYLFFRQ
jgi:uncharacterized SAM-binding protein YcdF (DUF218 family)